ncbi:MAG TPA: MFS transporter [Caulobacteraceae bacterium]|jgi:MFS family permease|nr:MFS transporter [Caulobacteraceae bacterium]
MNAPARSPTRPAFAWPPRETTRRVVVGFLLAAYTLNFIDRTIVTILGQAIKVDLKITDTQLGLLGGMAFALLYTVLGVPIARVAERRNRVTIISVSILVWSAFTAACGFASNFAALMAMRLGVGIGEAGCSPPSHALISDYFEPRRRASALAVYAFGIPLGGMIGAVIGGFLAKDYGWRVAFMVVGAPGLILAVLLKLIVREPPRGGSDPATPAIAPEDLAPAAAPAPPGRWLATELKELGIVTARLFGSWPILNMILGVTLVSIAGYGVGQFGAPYFNRAFGLDYATIGLIFGVIGGVSTGLGTLAGGFVADRASRRGARWYALTPAIGLAIAAPLYLIAYALNDWRLAAVVLLVPGVFHYTYLGPTFGVVQNAVEPRRRATATAVMFLFLNLIALGGGPLLTGALIDAFAQFHFTHAGPAGLTSAVHDLLAARTGAHFASACPGGGAPKGSPAALAARCHGALVAATRQGILVTVLFYLWGSFHYFLAAIGLEKRMARGSAG